MSSISEQKTERYTLELRSNDVLLGRGVPIFSHHGNIQFRRLVQLHKRQYSLVSRHQGKNDIVNEIVRTVEQGTGGRFLRQVKTSDEARSLGLDRGKLAWIIVSDDDKVKKVKQTLRDPVISRRSKNDEIDEMKKFHFVQHHDTITFHKSGILQPSDSSEKVSCPSSFVSTASDSVVSNSLVHTFVNNFSASQISLEPQDKVLNPSLQHYKANDKHTNEYERQELSPLPNRPDAASNLIITKDSMKSNEKVEKGQNADFLTTVISDCVQEQGILTTPFFQQLRSGQILNPCSHQILPKSCHILQELDCDSTLRQTIPTNVHSFQNPLILMSIPSSGQTSSQYSTGVLSSQQQLLNLQTLSNNNIRLGQLFQSPDSAARMNVTNSNVLLPIQDRGMSSRLLSLFLNRSQIPVVSYESQNQPM